MNDFFKPFHLSWSNFTGYLPALLGGILCFILTIILANFLSKISASYSLKRSKDPLIANFIGKIIWSVIFILGTVLSLGILGLGTVSNKILAGAGITTFVIGFALKDIGENFLSGIILAFSRPYHIGNLIECTGVKGIVKNMTMRQTTVEAENGKIIMIPNSSILKNPLIKYINDDNNLRREFNINVETEKVKDAIALISKTIHSFSYVVKENNKPVKVITEGLSGDKVKLLIIFWLDGENYNGSRSSSKTEIMLAVFEALQKAEFKFSG